MSIIDIPIKNSEVLECLNNFSDYYFNNKRDVVTKTIKGHLEFKPRRKEFMSDEYRDHIISQSEKHDGFPEACYGYNLKAERFEFTHDAKNEDIQELTKNYTRLNTDLQLVLNGKHNALNMLYPPEGYISWHNNANASAYNLIFTWSETGDGSFSYVDGHTGKTVVVPDVKGWQCKAGYFGSYEEPWYNRVYHAAETNCWRLTVSYIFDRTDMSKGLQDEIIEEIMSDF